jgi:uncharacterized protein YqjF (DUF2071 family)
MADNQFQHDASGRLTFEMFEVPASCYRLMCSAVATEFALAAQQPRIVDPLGDSVFQDYRRGEQVIAMEWDNYSGFTVYAKAADAEPLVKEIAAWLLQSAWEAPGTRRTFLTAEWRNLAILNYEVDPERLRPFVPKGTELDTWQGHTYVSLVGFLFANTRLLGVPVPFHTTFEEVNLRFYVRRTVNGEVRRAVTFLRELVPRRAIALVARLAYNEPYTALPMRHAYGPSSSEEIPSAVEYQWKAPTGWCGVRVVPVGASRPIEFGSEEEFITEHYWGYTRQRDGSTVEYRVTHPAWRVCSVNAPEATGDLAAVYGSDLASMLTAPPVSAFFATGSAVAVHMPARIGGG